MFSYQVLRLFWRVLRFAYPGAIMWVAIWIVDMDALFDGEFRPVRLHLLPLMFSANIGWTLGVVARGFHFMFLSWTLPNLRKQLISSILCIGIVTALLVTWIYKWLGGPAPWLPIFTSGFLWFNMGIVVGWRLVYVTKGDTDRSDHPIRSVGFACCTLLVLVLAGFWIDKMTDLFSTHPFLCIVLTTLGASLCFYNVFGVIASRKKMLFLKASLGRAGRRSNEREATTSKRSFSRKWEHAGPITGLLKWIRAGDYENLSAIPGGWLSLSIGLSATAVFFVTALGYYKGYGRGSHEMGIQFVYHAMVDPASFKKNTHVFVSMFLAILGIVYFIVAPFLQEGRLYPLSRTQLARCAYWGSFRYNAVFCGSMLLAFYFAAILIGFYAGYNAYFRFIPDSVRPLTLMFVFTPLMQWLRLRYGPIDVLLFPAMLIVCGVGVLGSLWLEVAQDIPAFYEVAACAGLILLSQCLYRYRLETYFRKADLI